MSPQFILMNLAIILGVTSLVAFLSKKFGWRETLSMFIFANRKIQILEGAGAISTHWIWAPALFISPAIAYNWGWQGLLWFIIPNGAAVWITGYLAYKVREREENSITNLVEQKSKALAAIIRFMFSGYTLAAFVLSFTITGKLWHYTIGGSTDLRIITAIAGILALIYTSSGGIRTSIFTGYSIFLAWVAMIVALFLNLPVDLFSLIVPGKHGNGFEHLAFYSTFALAFAPLIAVGATGHGMMWQKAMSMKRENILPSFFWGGVFFSLIVWFIGQSSLYVVQAGLPVKAPEEAMLVGISHLLGTAGLAAFIILFLWQTLTVMDSALNYLCYVVNEDIFNGKPGVRAIMFGTMASFVFVGWLIASFKLEIWFIFVIFSILRAVCFPAIWKIALGIDFDAKVAVSSIAIAAAISTTLSIMAKWYPGASLDAYAAYIALGLPWIATSLFGKRKTLVAQV